MKHYYVLKAYDMPGESHDIILDENGNITCTTRDLTQVDIAAVLFMYNTGVSVLEYDCNKLVVKD